jgi:hypothetical protein
MTVQEITAHDIVTFDDLRLLASASGPCIPIVVHVPTPLEASVRLKNATRTVERQLRDRKSGEPGTRRRTSSIPATREDLLNAAALQTVLHSGRAFALEGKDMPVPRELVGCWVF